MVILIFGRLCVMQVSLSLLVKLLDLIDLIRIEHILIAYLL